MITVTSDVRVPRDLSKYYGLECGTGHVNPVLVAQVLREKWDLPRLYFLGHSKKGPSGFAVITFMLDANGYTKAYLELLCSAHRAGSKLLRAAIKVSTDLGVDFVQLSAENMHLVKYYRKFGFVQLPNPCMRRHEIMDMRDRQYAKEDAGWVGYIDAGRAGTPVIHHVNGANGYLMGLGVQKKPKARTPGTPQISETRKPARAPTHLIKKRDGTLKFSKKIITMLIE